MRNFKSQVFFFFHKLQVVLQKYKFTPQSSIQFIEGNEMMGLPQQKTRQHRRIRAWVTLELKCQLPQGHLIYRFAHTLTLTYTKTSQSEPFKEHKRQEGEQSGVGGLSRVDGVA